MSGSAVVSARTRGQLAEVAAFFGIDLDANLHIFRHPAQVDARAFEVVVQALAEAVQQDVRFGANRRMREMAKSQKSQKGGPER